MFVVNGSEQTLPWRTFKNINLNLREPPDALCIISCGQQL